ncbi:hypothetical protein GMA12_09710 [Kocuria sediminis]|uniref:Uncharacterized protein n=1 Tax=Kocuria sediminis TaxID=1038857 RepID=A0A6N8GME5_9MICC|nr:hypothetical protein [Kocuria sediminis]MUN63412.1 hypothetical protein [Kocuria sediminis]
MVLIPVQLLKLLSPASKHDSKPGPNIIVVKAPERIGRPSTPCPQVREVERIHRVKEWASVLARAVVDPGGCQILDDQSTRSHDSDALTNELPLNAKLTDSTRNLRVKATCTGEVTAVEHHVIEENDSGEIGALWI